MDLYLIRGLPNSGKSTLAKTLAPNANYAADGYFELKALFLNISYPQAFERFRNEIGQAHEWCQEHVEAALKDNVRAVAVANTFTTFRELKHYLDLAVKYNYRVHVLTVERAHDGDNGHKVPDEAVKRMAERWQFVDKRMR